MKRLTLLLTGVMMVGVVALAAAGDFHTGTSLICSDCHVAHYSQSHGYTVGGLFVPLGTEGPYNDLLRDDENKLCLSCHNATFAQGANVGARMQAHWKGKGLADVAMGQGVRCIDCHNSLTAKSGAGRAQATIAGVTYYSGDITSHLFDVGRKTSIQQGGKGPEMMAIPYTNACGAVCHQNAP